MTTRSSRWQTETSTRGTSGSHQPARVSVAVAGAAAAVVASTSAAEAHVKWFCTIVDVRRAPEALGRVLTPEFAALFALFASLVFFGFLLDGAAARRWPGLASCGSRFDRLEDALVRIAVGAFFLLLWDKGAVVPWEQGNRALLTPELAVSRGWIDTVQIAIAALCVTRFTCVFAALGICALYGWGIRQFGVFHMVDYVFFPGIAAYLALSSLGVPAAVRARMPILSGTLAFGLMWTAVEKFVYPTWTLNVIAAYPAVAFGFEPSFVVVAAGFVEFTLAFFIMTGRGLVRFGAAGYALIFIAAIPEFGHLDSVGHIPIVGILAAVCLHGATPLQRLCRVQSLSRVPNAAAIAGLYVGSLASVMALYYGLHRAEYG